MQRSRQKNKQFKKQKSWSDKSLNGTFVNWALPSLHGGSLENTPTVP